MLKPSGSWLLLLLLATTARAQTQAPNCSPLSITQARLEAKRLLDNAEQARDRRAKFQALEAAYRLYQDPVILYNLGTLWYKAGKKVEGADLLRRYLYEAGTKVSDERRDRLARLLEKLRGPTAELDLSSEPCAFVYLDQRLVGRLPLSLPLLLRSGAHVLQVEKDHRRQELRATLERGARSLNVRLPATAVLLPEPATGDGDGHLLQAAADGTEQEGLTPIAGRAREAILGRLPQLQGCLGRRDCQEELARQLQAQYVLRFRAPAGGALSATLLDVETGAETSAQAGCPSCSAEQQAERLLGLVRDVLREGLSRPKGTLAVTAVPEAEVTMDGQRLGRTPLLRSALAGKHDLLVSAVGYRPERAQLQVEDGKHATLEVLLRVDSQPPPPVAAKEPPPQQPAERVVLPREERGPRPRWRLIAGGVTVALGTGLLALGGAALAVNGECPPDQAMPCTRTYHSLAPGGAMLGVGAAMTLSGIVALAWPGPRRAGGRD